MNPENEEVRPPAQGADSDGFATEANATAHPALQPWLQRILTVVGWTISDDQLTRDYYTGEGEGTFEVCDHPLVAAEGGTLDLALDGEPLTLRCDSCADAYREGLPSRECYKCGWPATRLLNVMPWPPHTVRMDMCPECLAAELGAGA